MKDDNSHDREETGSRAVASLFLAIALVCFAAALVLVFLPINYPTH